MSPLENELIKERPGLRELSELSELFRDLELSLQSRNQNSNRLFSGITLPSDTKASSWRQENSDAMPEFITSAATRASTLTPFSPQDDTRQAHDLSHLSQSTQINSNRFWKQSLVLSTSHNAFPDQLTLVLKVLPKNRISNCCSQGTRVPSNWISVIFTSLAISHFSKETIRC